MERGEWSKAICGGCKKSFELQPATYRGRMKRSKDGQIYCSRHCVHVKRWKEQSDPTSELDYSYTPESV